MTQRRRSLTIVFATALLVGCTSDLCGNSVKAAYPSPDGLLRAVSFERDCGATTGFSTQLSILAANEPLPNDAGNAIVVSGQAAFIATWDGNAHVIIRAVGVDRVFKNEKLVRGVKVEFKK